jgi:hypothetical protein
MTPLHSNTCDTRDWGVFLLWPVCVLLAGGGARGWWWLVAAGEHKALGRLHCIESLAWLQCLRIKLCPANQRCQRRAQRPGAGQGQGQEQGRFLIRDAARLCLLLHKRIHS